MSAILDLDPVFRFPDHDLLALEALICGGQTGDIAFRRWIDTVDLEGMSAASTELLPLLFARHVQGNPHLPHYPRIKGVHRLAHVRNSLLLDSAASAARFLAGSGIEAMMIKGASLALARYPHPGLRPMGDVDLLVKANDYQRANAMLQESGWRYRYNAAHRRQVNHSCDYITHDGRALDLHVRALLEVDDPDFEAGLFTRAHRLSWAGMNVLIPSPEDEALVCLVNAVRDAGAARPIWVIDLAHLETSCAPLDWHALWQRANRFGIAREVLHALQVASHIRGNEALHAMLERQIATTPGFERDYLETVVSSGSTYAIPETKRQEVDRTLAANAGPADFAATARNWSALTETRAAFGTIRVFETPGGQIKSLHLRWRHLRLVPMLFAVTDQGQWEEICRQSPTMGEGTLDVRPGMLRWKPAGDLPPQVYQASIKLTSPLPRSLSPSATITLSAIVGNSSGGPWFATARPPYATGLSWHVQAPTGETITWDNQRLYLRPDVMKEHHFSFVEPGASLACQLPFTAPEKPGRYRITFDLVHELVRWFSVTPDTLPAWDLTVE